MISVEASDAFKGELKRLRKKYRSLDDDVDGLVSKLLLDPTFGQHLGNNCYKIRLNIRSKRAGAAGGARVITYVILAGNRLVLLALYDKSEIASLSEKAIKSIIDSVK